MARFYRVHWLGYPDDQDTWEHGPTLALERARAESAPGAGKYAAARAAAIAVDSRGLVAVTLAAGAAGTAPTADFAPCTVSPDAEVALCMLPSLAEVIAIEDTKNHSAARLVSSLPMEYRKLVQGLVSPYQMWQKLESHFGTRDPTDYAAAYQGVFRLRIEEVENSEMFVQTLDANIITFERVTNSQLSDMFKSMILQHALPQSWEYIIRGWLGQAKVLPYVKLMELVSSELKRRHQESNGQDKGRTEKAYAVVEATPPAEVIADKKGEKVKTDGPPKKKQNVGKSGNKNQQEHEEADYDDDLPGVRVMTRDDIIKNINMNHKMSPADKRLARQYVKRQFDLEIAFEPEQVKLRRQQIELMLLERRLQADKERHETNKEVDKSSDDEAQTYNKGMAGSAASEAQSAGEAVAKPMVVVEPEAKGPPAIGVKPHSTEQSWVVDTGATSHMCKDLSLFVSLEPCVSTMETAANPLAIYGKGTVRFPVRDVQGTVRTIELKEVNFVPRIAHNLLSVKKALKNDGFSITIDETECRLRHGEGGYVVSARDTGSVELRTGHPGVNVMRELHKIYFESGATFSGYRYFVVFVDEYTRYLFTFLMKTRDELYHVYESLRRKVRKEINYVYSVVAVYDEEIMRVQSDNAKEYEKLARQVAQYGHLPCALWGEAVMTATYLINITPREAIDMRSPYQVWHHRIPTIKKLRVFGCSAYAWIPKDKRTKIEAHAVKCMFVGYDEEDRPDGPVDRFKARLVIKGFLQKYGVDYTEIFAPVVRMEILRLLLALAAAMDWEVEQMDVKTAFLNGYLEEEIYMEQPMGYTVLASELDIQ
ncbi:hypothetical protein P43SY_011689 [Pythium insidiosum]|uniref:Reverse transcriptase Ty1/copia-type domain-containing protein n=1 Tax=Pythium insidiosum TaxID=114742 RepID=A0AAD5L8U0_PYTIN|nr:hypothetical protein P43SY_011689 [Pythium insidiosum]